MAIYADSIGAKQYHYRDSNGLEVDSIIEMPDGRWGARITPSILCVICGVADRAFRTNDGVYVVPITSLKP